METINKYLDVNRTLNEAIPVLVEVFVNFYGEECREYINNKFNNMILVGYYGRDTLNNLISEMKKKLTKQYVKEVFDKFQIEYNDEGKYTAGNTFDYINLFPIIDVYEYITMIKKGEKELLKEEQLRRYNIFKKYIPQLEFDDFVNREISDELINKLPYYIRSNIDYWVLEYDISKTITNKKNSVIDKIKQLCPDVTYDNVDELILDGKLDGLFNIGKEFNNACIKYREYNEKNINKYVLLVDKLNDLKRKIECKYLIQYYTELKDYLNKEDQDKLVELATKDEIYSSDLGDIDVLFGNSLNIGSTLDSSGAIQYFDSQSEEELKKRDVKLYRQETIKSNRIKYFKYHGIDLGDNYEDYVNNPKCREIWPSQEMVARIEERYNYYRNKANIEYFTNFDIYKETMDKTTSMGLLDNDGLFRPEMFLRQQTCVLTNIRENHEEYELYPLVCIYARHNEFDDKTLIHELNHLFELTLTKANKDGYEAICGWDILNCPINNDMHTDTINTDRERRGYESFNEIINELLTRKITKEMHDSGVFILNSQDSYRDRGGTTYDFSSFLVEEFFNEYLNDIIESRRNNNIEIIWNKVGKENFDDLNQLFHEFNDTFTEFVYYRLYDDLKNKRDSKLVHQYNALVARRDLILKKMNQHSKGNGMNL